jgi:hypothetical protein
LEYAVLLVKIKNMDTMFISLHELDKIEVNLSPEKRREIKKNFIEWVKQLQNYAL